MIKINKPGLWRIDELYFGGVIKDRYEIKVIEEHPSEYPPVEPKWHKFWVDSDNNIFATSGSKLAIGKLL